jgi:hypothetical protein
MHCHAFRRHALHCAIVAMALIVIGSARTRAQTTDLGVNDRVIIAAKSTRCSSSISRTGTALRVPRPKGRSASTSIRWSEGGEWPGCCTA